MANRKRTFEKWTDIADCLYGEVSREAPSFYKIKKLLTMLKWAHGQFKLHGDETNIYIPPWSFHMLPSNGDNWKKELRQADVYLANLTEGTDYYAFSNMTPIYEEGMKGFIKFLRDIALKKQRDYCRDLDQGRYDPPLSLQVPQTHPTEHEEALEESIEVSDESAEEDVIKMTDIHVAHDHAPVTYRSLLTRLLDDKLRRSFFAYLSRRNGVTTVKDLFSKAASVDIPEGTMIAETFAPEDQCCELLKPIALALEERSRGQSEEVVVAERLHVTRRISMLLLNFLEILLCDCLGAQEGVGGK